MIKEVRANLKCSWWSTMFDSETHLSPSRDVDIDLDKISRFKVSTPSSQRDCFNTSYTTFTKQHSNSTYIANAVDVMNEQTHNGIDSVKDLLLNQKHRLNSGNNERFPTYVIPNEMPAAIKKPSLLKSPVATSNFNQIANRAFHFTSKNKHIPRFQNSSSVAKGVDWGDDDEWILLFDNLLKSNPTCASYKKQRSSDVHGNCLEDFTSAFDFN
jgi:hypothetical protein